MPALPLDSAGPYVAGAYLVFLGLILAYVGIMASKLARIAREVAELERLASGDAAAHPDPERTVAAAERVAESAPVGTPSP